MTQGFNAGIRVIYECGYGNYQGCGKEAGVSVATVSRVINNSPKRAEHRLEIVNSAMQN